MIPRAVDVTGLDGRPVSLTAQQVDDFGAPAKRPDAGWPGQGAVTTTIMRRGLTAVRR